MTEYEIVEEPNYTQIPNVFFEHWMSVLTHVEFKVLMCISRKTFGWRKDIESISISQIIAMTKVSRQATCNAIRELQVHGLIIKEKHTSMEHGNEASTFKVLVRSPVKCLKNVQASTLSRQGASLLNRQGLVYSVDTQKKEIQKEKKLLPISPQTSLKELVVVVPSICLEVGGTQEDFDRLRKDFTEEKIVEACQLAKDQGAEIRIFYGWVKDCITRGYTATATPEDVTAKNRTLAREKFNALDGKEVGGACIHILSQWIEFVFTANIEPHAIPYSRLNFEVEVRAYLQQLRERHTSR